MQSKALTFTGTYIAQEVFATPYFNSKNFKRKCIVENPTRTATRSKINRNDLVVPVEIDLLEFLIDIQPCEHIWNPVNIERIAIAANLQGGEGREGKGERKEQLFITQPTIFSPSGIMKGKNLRAHVFRDRFLVNLRWRWRRSGCA